MLLYQFTLQSKMESEEPEISRFSDQLNLEIAQAHFQSALPDGWVMTSSKSQGGRTYYFNVASGESRWDHPLLPDEDCQRVGFRPQILRGKNFER